MFEAPPNFYFIPLVAFKLQKHCRVLSTLNSQVKKQMKCKRQRLYIFTFICFQNMPLDLLFANVDKLCADLLIVRVLFIKG
jgi:hypothetical protein